MNTGEWGYCSESCPTEKDNFCFTKSGSSLGSLGKCIFPFIFNGQKHFRCFDYDGKVQCATKVNKDGIANPSDLQECSNQKECTDEKKVNGHIVSVGYVTVASYTNFGDNCMTVQFQYSTGFEDTTSYNWNVEASVSAEFSYFGAEFGASLTAGYEGGKSGTETSGVTHALLYNVAPKSRVTLRQMVAKAGNIKAHSFKIQLDETPLNSNHVVKETINGEKVDNGTKVAEIMPCPKGSSDDGDDEDSDDGDDDDDDDEEEDECSNEKYGEKDENGVKNENCSEKSQEEADEEKKKEEEEKKKQKDSNENSGEEKNDEEKDDEEKDDEDEETKKKTTTTEKTTTKRRPKRA